MCGITGILDFGAGKRFDREGLRKMADLISHRGPDQEGYFLDKTAALAFRRLAILDLSPRGHQPMANEDGTLQLVFNGEIYNHHALGDALRERHDFRSSSDSEVLLHLYEEKGVGLLQDLRGMFSFALYDSKRRRLFAARDRLGKKPLYYRYQDDRLAFASELRPLLLDRQEPPAIDEDAIRAYLSLGYIPPPRTAFVGINQLPPGHQLVADPDGLTVKRYWDLSYGAIDDPDAANRTLELLREAVKLRLESDVPLGAFLSGGVDSTTVVALARPHVDRFNTFSVDFDEPGYDESQYSRLASEALETDHHRVTCRPQDLELLPQIAWHHGQPFADSSAVPTFVVSRLARKHVTVVLTGEGGDENFGGYDRYLAIEKAARLRKVPKPLRAAAQGLLRMVPSGPGQKNRIRLAKRFLAISDGDPSTQYRNLISVFPDTELPEPPPDFAVEALAQPFRSPNELLHRMLRTDVQSYLPNDLLVKVDIASMANSIEARAPFLDHVLMEYVAQLAPRFKTKGLQKKVLLRRVAAGLVPKPILARRKMGFAVPIAPWFRGPARHMLDGLAQEPGALATRHVGADRVLRLIEQHRRGRDHTHRLWALLMLREWEDQFRAGRLTRPLHAAALPVAA